MESLNSAKPKPRWIRKISIPAAIAVPLCGISAWCLLLRAPDPQLLHLPLTRQATTYTCGAASLQSILAYYGQEWREETLAEELKSDPEQGTNYRELVRFAQSKGLAAEVREGMTIEALAQAIKEEHPVMVAIQAWGDHPEHYAEDWDDGHYSIVVGLDRANVYLMDPSTIGNYTFIPIQKFLERWHDAEFGPDGHLHKLIHFGIVFGKGKEPSYNPESLKPLD